VPTIHQTIVSATIYRCYRKYLLRNHELTYLTSAARQHRHHQRIPNDDVRRLHHLAPETMTFLQIIYPVLSIACDSCMIRSILRLHVVTGQPKHKAPTRITINNRSTFSDETTWNFNEPSKARPRDMDNYKINDDNTAVLQRHPERVPAQMNTINTDLPSKHNRRQPQLSLTRTRTST